MRAADLCPGCLCIPPSQCDGGSESVVAGKTWFRSDSLQRSRNDGPLQLSRDRHPARGNPCREYAQEFEQIAKAWLATAEHPKLKRLYKECLYQPQLELLAYLRSNGFKMFIVTGGGIDFVRAFAEDAYGVPPERVIGSSAKTRFEVRDGKPDLIKLPELNSIDDREGKPININLHIGRRPILAFGNSDGDLQMLEYTAGGPGRGCPSWFTTTTRSANMLTTVARASDNSIKPWMLPSNKAGPWLA